MLKKDSRIKVICFDLDGLVIQSPGYYSVSLVERFNISKEDAAFYKDPNFDKCKRGEIDFDSFFKSHYNQMRTYPKYNFSYEEAKKDWFEYSKLNQKVYTFAKRLKDQGLRCTILTNNLQERVEYINKLYDLSELFKIIGSYDLGYMKPNVKFFKMAAQELKVKPQEIVFSDDSVESLFGAKELGIQTFVYENFEQFKEELSKYIKLK